MVSMEIFCSTLYYFWLVYTYNPLASSWWGFVFYIMFSIALYEITIVFFPDADANDLYCGYEVDRSFAYDMNAPIGSWQNDVWV